jgi:DNA polymerase alpha subunit A
MYSLPLHYPPGSSTPLTRSALFSGKRDGVLPGETVPYVICRQRGADGELLALGGKGGVAERAHHPEELLADPSLVVDLEYYLMQQVGCVCVCGLAWEVVMLWRHGCDGDA